jgi:hypothetical protein
MTVNKITITLDVTLQQASKIIAMLQDTSSEAYIAAAANDMLKEDPLHTVGPKKPSKAGIEDKVVEKVVVAPTAGKITKMPSLGRTQAQVDSYASERKTRVEELDEEAILKAERDEERRLLKEEKQKALEDKKAELKLQEEEVAKIKATSVVEVQAPVSKPNWLKAKLESK